MFGVKDFSIIPNEKLDADVCNPVKKLKNSFLYSPNQGIELNDEYLMKLILDYPIMCDPTRYFYVPDDEYLQPYAWNFIAEKFNEKYRELGISALFLAEFLRLRWDELIPLIKQISVPPYISEVPMPMQAYVRELRTYFDKEFWPKKDIGSIQLSLTNNIEYIKSLPIEKQVELETYFVKTISEYEMETLAIYPTVDSLQRIQDDVHNVFTLTQCARGK